MRLIVESLVLGLAAYCSSLATPVSRSFTEYGEGNSLIRKAKRFGPARYEDKREYPQWMQDMLDTTQRKRSTETSGYEMSPQPQTDDSSGWRPEKRAFGDIGGEMNGQPGWMVNYLSDGDNGKTSEFQHRTQKRAMDTYANVKEKNEGYPPYIYIQPQAPTQTDRLIHLLELLREVCHEKDILTLTMENADDEEKRVFGSARLAGKRNGEKPKAIFYSKGNMEFNKKATDDSRNTLQQDEGERLINRVERAIEEP